MGLVSRVKNAWNAFANDGFIKTNSHYMSADRAGKSNISFTNTRTLMTAIKTLIANDCASVRLEHVTVDDNENYLKSKPTGLQRCLTLSSNLDQSSREFKLDLFYSLLDDGDIAIVPVDTDLNPYMSDGYDILSMRIGKIQQWAPTMVQVNLYDERDGQYKDIWVNKEQTAIIENPFYHIMNAHNSTFKRLENKLALLDTVDSHNASAKLDMIIQLPYKIRSEKQLALANERRNEIVNQLQSSEYGIAYIDATEHVTQLNRPVENNLMPQIEYLTKQLYYQLGINESLLSGDASEQVLLNYTRRIIQPILETVANEFTRKFITKTGYTQGQRIKYFDDRFKMVPLDKLASFADVASRNEIMFPNEIRSILGLKASDDPRANTLSNRNMPDSGGTYPEQTEDPSQLSISDIPKPTDGF